MSFIQIVSQAYKSKSVHDKICTKIPLQVFVRHLIYLAVTQFHYSLGFPLDSDHLLLN